MHFHCTWGIKVVIQMKNSEEFLLKAKDISENQSLYPILSDLAKTFKDKHLILSFCSETKILDISRSKIQDYVNTNYKQFSMQEFQIKSDDSIDIINLSVRTSESNIALINNAVEKSKDYAYKDYFFLVIHPDSNILICNGLIDEKFNNFIADKTKKLQEEQSKKGLDELEWIFSDYHMDRKFNHRDKFIVNGKVRDDISEQELRNDLIKYFENHTKVFPFAEFCTSLSNDEESSDIALLDKIYNRIAIIEVKFFVKKGYFVSPQKTKYGNKIPERYRDGFVKLNKYCKHISTDFSNLSILSSWLYMFYASSDKQCLIEINSDNYFSDFIKSDEEKCDTFNQTFKKVIHDDLLVL